MTLKLTISNQLLNSKKKFNTTDLNNVVSDFDDHFIIERIRGFLPAL